MIEVLPGVTTVWLAFCYETLLSVHLSQCGAVEACIENCKDMYGHEEFTTPATTLMNEGKYTEAMDTIQRLTRGADHVVHVHILKP